jgi:hypothetical protein
MRPAGSLVRLDICERMALELSLLTMKEAAELAALPVAILRREIDLRRLPARVALPGSGLSPGLLRIVAADLARYARAPSPELVEHFGAVHAFDQALETVIATLGEAFQCLRHRLLVRCLRRARAAAEARPTARGWPDPTHRVRVLFVRAGYEETGGIWRPKVGFERCAPRRLRVLLRML